MTRTTSKWPWSKSLALAPPGEALEVEDILFGAVQDHCWELGIRRGSVVTTASADDDGVEITLPTGQSARIARHFAWFVAVRKVSGPGSSGTVAKRAH